MSAKQSKYAMAIHLFLYICIYNGWLAELGIRFELTCNVVVEACLRKKCSLELILINTFLTSGLM